MAISKERLEEIVKEYKTFWWCQPYADSFIVREIRQPRVEVVVKEKYCVLIENDKEYLAEFEHLTEDKEDAEELAEFGNITRMEKLELPTLKQIQHNTIGWVKYFKGADNNDYALKVDFMCDTISIIDTNKLKAIKEYNHISQPEFLSAKRLCVKLFRGESV